MKCVVLLAIALPAKVAAQASAAETRSCCDDHEFSCDSWMFDDADGNQVMGRGCCPTACSDTITTAGPTTAGWRCPEGQYYKVAAGSFTCPPCPKDTYWVGYAENLAYGDLECAECPDQHTSPEGSIGSSACIDQSPASVTLIVLAIILPALFVILWASCAYKKGLFRNQRGGQHPPAPSLTHAHTSLAPLRRQGKRAGAQGVANRVLGHLRRPIHLCGRHVLSMLSVLRCNG